MGRIDDIKTEIDTDPLSRSYSTKSDAEVAADMMTFYRNAEGGVAAMLKYVSENKSRTNNGSDTDSVPILWRLEKVAKGVEATDVFGSTHNLQRKEIAAAVAFQVIISSSHLESIDFATTEVSDLLLELQNGQVMKAGDVTAIKALSENKQTRAGELGIGRVMTGNVTEARALP